MFNLNINVTVSGGKYVIDGVSQKTLTLYEGNTYIFDQWTKNADNSQQDKLSKENEDLVDSFVDVEMQEDAKK